MRKIAVVFAASVWTALAVSHQAEASGASVGFYTIAPLPSIARSPPQGNGPDALVIPVQGGPDFLEVYGVPPGDKLNIREGIGTGHRIIARVPNGEVLRNLGCRSSGGSRWCHVETRDGRARGWASNQFLHEAGGTAASGGSSDVPELVARNSGEIEVRWSSGCTMLYNSRGNRLQSGSSCSRSQRARSDDAVARYLREQGGSSAGGGGTGGAMDMRGNGAVTRGGPATGHIFSRNGRTYALVITASRDGLTCTGSFDRSPGSRDSMSTPINCTNGTSGTAILVARNNGYMLTFSTVSGAGGYVQFR